MLLNKALHNDNLCLQSQLYPYSRFYNYSIKKKKKSNVLV